MNELRHKILVVDDDPDITALCEKALAAQGYEVTGAVSGEVALEQLREEAFDAALIDLVLPGVGGMEVVAAAREADPTAVVVIITGFASLDSAIEAVRHGAFDYVRKPFDVAQLVDTVARGLEGRDLFRRNQRLLAELDQANRQMRQDQRTLQERVRELQRPLDTLVELARRLCRVHSVPAILHQLLETATTLTGVRAGVIFQIDTTLKQLRAIVCRGIDPGELGSEQLGLGQGVLGTVAASGAREVVNNLLSDPAMAEDVLVYAGMQRVLAYPLVAAGQTLGVMALFDDREQPFSAQEQDMAAIVAVQAATVLAATGAARAAPRPAGPGELDADEEFIDLEGLLGS